MAREYLTLEALIIDLKEKTEPMRDVYLREPVGLRES